MSKIELNTSIADYGFSQINANFQLIEDELNQKVLYRDNPVGEPNTIENQIDANDNNIINVNDLRVDNEIYLKGETISQAIDTAAGGLVGDAEQAAINAAASASQSAASATASAASAAASEASFDSFDDRYLGAKNSPPTTDNDGNPLLIGALYWDTTLSPGGTFPATDITVTPAGGIGSTTVQAALQELDTEKANIASPTFTGTVTIPTEVVTTSTITTATITTLNTTGNFTPSQTNGIVGTTTNNNANAGSVGEFISSSTTGTAMTSGANANVHSISLTAGDWDVSGSVQFNPAGTTTVANIVGGASTTSATFGAFGTFNSMAATFTTGAQQRYQVPTVRFSLSATTTIFLVAQTTFGVSTMTADGFLRARRIR